MDTVVQKYGGTSIAAPAQVRGVAERLARDHRAGRATVVVVSARGRATDELLELAAAVSPVRPARELDQLMATGESASAAVLALALCGLGVPAISLTGPQAGVLVTGEHGAGVVAAVHSDRICAQLARGVVVVVAGFQGLNAAGDVVTLGRGGSDTTAVALAAALGLDSCEIYTDVAGVCTADPHLVEDSRRLAHLPLAVMTEMALTGATVLHPRAALLAAAHAIDIHIGHASGSTGGTLVHSTPAGLEPTEAVVAVTHDLDVVPVRLRCGAGWPTFAVEALAVLDRHGATAGVVTGGATGGGRLELRVEQRSLEVVLTALRPVVAAGGGELEVDRNTAMVTLVASGLAPDSRHIGRALARLARAGIEVAGIQAGRLSVSLFLARSRTRDAVRLLHDEFGLAQGQAGADQRRALCH